MLFLFITCILCLIFYPVFILMQQFLNMIHKRIFININQVDYEEED
jgi:hypothetical protein